MLTRYYNLEPFISIIINDFDYIKMAIVLSDHCTELKLVFDNFFLDNGFYCIASGPKKDKEVCSLCHWLYNESPFLLYNTEKNEK